MSDPNALLIALNEALAATSDPNEIEQLKRTHLGKKSAIRQALGGLRNVAPEERASVAASINAVRGEMEEAVEQALEQATAKALEAQLDAEWQDLSLPGQPMTRGRIHPVTQVEERVMDVLRTLGFEAVDGPEVEHPYYNFDALNIPEHHPARDMQDTFWVTDGFLLRSHTTTVQARVLEERDTLPIKIASYGRTYRNEAVDATHLAMFHQFEGLWIEEGLTFAHLKGVLSHIAKALYGDHPVRFKPKFYPYTEPSVGVDLQCTGCLGTGTTGDEPCPSCHGAGWVTILGAGMVHPKVFREFGFDPTVVSGIAFGLGTTRMACQLAGEKPRPLYELDMRVHDALRGRTT